jgi:hypothetical protein
MGVKLFDEVDSEKESLGDPQHQGLRTPYMCKYNTLQSRITSNSCVSHARVKFSAIPIVQVTHYQVALAFNAQVEIRMYKVTSGVSWPTLEASDTLPAANWSLPTVPPRVHTLPLTSGPHLFGSVQCHCSCRHVMGAAALHDARAHYSRAAVTTLVPWLQTYPSSRKQVVDWDKMEYELKEEEKTEVLDGEAGAQKLFRTIYAGTPATSLLSIHMCLIVNMLVV